MYDFSFGPLSRVTFRQGALEELPVEAAKLGKRFLLLSTPEQRDLAERAAEIMGDLGVGIFSEAKMHVPVDTARAAIAEAERLNADGCIALGGGSTTGLGKAIALETGRPIIAVPTTYAGSEATRMWGMTEGGVKRTGRDEKVLPRTIIYDPELTFTLPAGLSATSGMNAIAHCVEALYGETASRISSLMAQEGIRAFAQGLPKIVQNPQDADARHEALYGAWLAGVVMDAVGIALHHKLCHILGGAFNLPHAEMNAVVLPHATAYNAPGAPEAMERIKTALGAGDAATGLYDLARRINAPKSLKEIGMPEDGIEKVVETAMKGSYYNPSPLQADAVRRLLRNAYEGLPPEPYLAAA